ncbi:MAG: uracil-DNA glycosylase [Erysipelotrichaceae bacterium]|nr:uracil-DNA glycosylase [Erysipelotrichaceae bacterium]
MNFNEIIKGQFEEAYFKKLSLFLKEAYDSKIIYPPKEQIFNAFSYFDYNELKVILIGQDPYHQPHQAHGLCFSVNPGIDFPPSLQNIFKELSDDLGCIPPRSGSLIPWATQGVLLLNTILTVEANQPLSHQDQGWEIFTDRILSLCNKHPEPCVFILWGKNAQSKASLITDPKHLILMAPHPSPLSVYRGFYGSKPFSKTNAFLLKNGRKEINWCL